MLCPRQPERAPSTLALLAAASSPGSHPPRGDSPRDLRAASAHHAQMRDHSQLRHVFSSQPPHLLACTDPTPDLPQPQARVARHKHQSGNTKTPPSCNSATPTRLPKAQPRRTSSRSSCHQQPERRKTLHARLSARGQKGAPSTRNTTSQRALAPTSACTHRDHARRDNNIICRAPVRTTEFEFSGEDRAPQPQPAGPGARGRRARIVACCAHDIKTIPRGPRPLQLVVGRRRARAQ